MKMLYLIKTLIAALIIVAVGEALKTALSALSESLYDFEWLSFLSHSKSALPMALPLVKR